jgi:hypothetical protein
MGAAKSGGREVRTGEVFVESAEKTGFPGFGVSARATTVPCWGEEGCRKKKKCNLPDQKLTAGCILNKTRKFKMEIPDKVKHLVSMV